VRLTTKLVTYTPLGNPPESVQSGNYGNPPNAWWWLKQSIIYFCGLMGMKICVLIIFMVFPWISHVGDWALGWTEGNERLQIVFVMMLFPLIMNALQYYIIDSYIKKQEEAYDGEDGSSTIGHDGLERGGGVARGGAAPASYEALSGSSAGSDTEDSDGESDGDSHHKKRRSGRRESGVRMATRSPPTGATPTSQHQQQRERDIEYDPAVDGDSQTVIGSSTSRTSTIPNNSRRGESREGALPKELIPHE